MPATTNAPPCAAPDPNPHPPSHAMPALACDAHMHICGPESRYAYSSARIYTPPDALLPAYLQLTQNLGLQRVVFVQPSIYGTDNSAMLDAIASCPLECRGIAVIDAGISNTKLRALHDVGIRGVRLNIVDTHEPQPTLPVDEIRALASRLAPLGWHLELLLHADDYPSLDSQLGDLPVDVVVGHLGYLRRGVFANDPGFRALLRLLERGRCWVKLTGPYRLTDAPYPYAPSEPIVRGLLEAAPERLVWGSDWPHVMLRGEMPNDGALLDLLFDWAGSAHVARRILVENPATLYDFKQPDRVSDIAADRS